MNIEAFKKKLRGKEDITYGEIGDAITSVKTKEEARLLLADFVSHHVRHFDVTTEAAIKNVKDNIGYIAGYYDPKTAQQVHELFDCSHPIFGRTTPTADEAFKAGYDLAKKSKA